MTMVYRGIGGRARVACLMASTALAGVCFAAPAHAAQPERRAASVQLAQAEITRGFDIPAQGLSGALTAFAQQSGLQITMDSAILKGLSSPGVSGTMSPAAALTQVLAGTGIVWQMIDAKTVALSKVAADADGVMTLDAVTVEGNGTSGVSSQVVSEGTRSYAAKGVTLAKTEKTLREIPQSVSVITRQAMDDQAMTSVAEVLRSAPGVSAHGYPGNSAYSRGYLMSAQRDGVPSQDTTYETTYDLAILDRVEIMRGPTGMLTGKGEPGGVVNYVRKRPLDHLAASGVASVGSWGTYRAVADATTPLTEDGSVRGRLIAADKTGDTFYDVGSSSRQTFFGTVEADVSPNTTVGFTAIHAREDYIQNSGLPTYSDGSIPGRTAFVGTDDESERRIYELAGDIKHRFDNGWTARLAAFHITKSDDVFTAYAGSTISTTTGLSSVTASYGETDTEAQGIDASVTGPLHLFGQEHTLTAGYNWAGSNALTGSSIASYSNVNPLTLHHFNVSTNIASRTRTRDQQSGYYGVASIKPIEPLTVILGGRVTDFSSKTRTEVNGTTTAWNRSRARADDKFSPYGGVVVDVNRQVSVYASYTDIFVPQTQISASGEALDPREGWQAETGIKGAFLDDRLNTSLALFRLREQNRAQTDSVNQNCNGAGYTCYTAAGETLIQGVEAEVTGMVLPRLELTAAYTYIDAKYLNDKSNPGGRFSADTAPKHMVKLWGNYRFGEEAADGKYLGWSLGGGVVGKSLTYSSTVRQDAYAVVSARVGYDFNENVGLNLNVENLFDETYLLNKGYATYYTKYEAPRNFTLALTAKF